MPRQRRVTIPKVTTPATMYLVVWVDANHDQEYEGPAENFASFLVPDYFVGFHVKTAKDHIVMAGGSDVVDGVNSSRYHLTIPRVHIRSMYRWGTREEIEGQHASKE